MLLRLSNFSEPVYLDANLLPRLYKTLKGSAISNITPSKNNSIKPLTYCDNLSILLTCLE